MTDLEQRLVHLEREVARLRHRNLAIVGVAIVVVAFACKTRPAQPPPITSVHFGDVTLDDHGLTVKGTADRRITLDANGLALADGPVQTTLAPGVLREFGTGTTVRLGLKVGGLSVVGDHHTLLAAVADHSARVSVDAADPDLSAMLLVRRAAGRATVTATAAAAAKDEGGMTGMTASPDGARIDVSLGKDQKDLSVNKPAK